MSPALILLQKLESEKDIKCKYLPRHLSCPRKGRWSSGEFGEVHQLHRTGRLNSIYVDLSRFWGQIVTNSN